MRISCPVCRNLLVPKRVQCAEHYHTRLICLCGFDAILDMEIYL